MTKTYDSRSYELAEHFLISYFTSPDYSRLCDLLAKDIQEAAEDFIFEIESGAMKVKR